MDEARKESDRKQNFLIGAYVFIVALAVRLLAWHDFRFEARNVQTTVTHFYKLAGRLLLENGIGSFFNSLSSLNNLELLGHPPGYPFLIACIFRLFGDSDKAIQLTQVVCDAFACVMVFSIAAALLPRAVAVIAGALAAIAPQFSYNSVMLLPDTLAVLPILLAVYCLVRARTHPRLLTFVLAGGLVGAPCWMRANALLLAPFLALTIPILFERGKRLHYGAALVLGAAIVIAPVTIRNAVVFGEFIPLSLGAGQTLLEGIADYDEEGRFGFSTLDIGITRQEAEMYNRPDYAKSLFDPDGVKRDRMRVARGIAVIRANPVWFTSVMIRRAVSMLKLERVRLISPYPPVTHPLTYDRTQMVQSVSPSALVTTGTLNSPQAEVNISESEQAIRITGDESKYAPQFSSAPLPVKPNTDYVLRLNVKLEQERMMLSVVAADTNRQYALKILDPPEATPTGEPINGVVELPFVSMNVERVILVISNGGSRNGRPVVQVGELELVELGSSSYLWTHYPRVVIRTLQKLFITALMLPLVIMGIALLARARQWRVATIILVVPLYYFCIQSALHTEYRYVMVIHYFLFIFAAVALHRAGSLLSEFRQKRFAARVARP